MAAKPIPAIARTVIAVSMAGFGIQQLAYGHFVRWVAKLPAWAPAPAIWPYVTGGIFILAAGSMLIRKQARTAALILSAMILVIAVLLNTMAASSNPSVADMWGRAGKAFALSGAAALAAESIRKERVAWSMRFLEALIPLGPFFCIAGVEHFIYAKFVEQMVPAWIPARVFWTYFTGVALLAGGIGMLMPKVSRLAGTLSGVMVFSWVVLLHIPRAFANLHNTTETTAIFEALAIASAAFLVASR